MARPLPPLNQLRAFEVAARHLSFSRAALELCVTPAAVSHHIRSLEEYLNCKLFERLTRRLVLTNDGEALLPVVRKSFDSVAVEINRLRSLSGRQRLVIRMPAFLSAWWLAPRLNNFVDQHPGIELTLEHSTHTVDFRAENVDIAVQWTKPTHPGVIFEPLIATRRVATCSAGLLLRQPSRHVATDIEDFNLLHEFSYEDWEQWYEMHGLNPADARRGFVYDNYEVLVRATVAGQGVALLMSSRWGADWGYSDLKEPFGDTGPDFTYYVLYPREALQKPIVNAFRKWLMEQARP